MDIRNQKLAANLVNYSCRLQKGEKILIEATGSQTIPLVNLIVKEVYKAGGLPFVTVRSETTERELLLNASEDQLKLRAEIETRMMREMNAYIAIRGSANASESSDIPSDRLNLAQKLYTRPVSDIRISSTKWCVLRYPTPNMAQKAGMSTEAFEEFYYNVCNLDYSKMAKAMDPMKALMERTDKVRLTGRDTDLTFSIKDIPVRKCEGRRNIPDGEIFSAPVKDSVNGYITYNTPSEFRGFMFENIRLEFKDGRIVNATANDTARITDIFNMDEGARHIGEFALGVNPFITKPMNDTLFDEKIMGSFHFTPGNCYDDVSNGNKSSIHWDLVFIQTEEYGGGEIYFDDVLIRKNGRFVLEELAGLNPENLM